MTIALSALAVAIVCALALSIGMAMQQNRIAASLPEWSGAGTGQETMGHGRPLSHLPCSVPTLPGAVVDVTLTDMHGMMGPGGMMGSPMGMMGSPMGMMGPPMGMMRIIIDPGTVPQGQVSFRVANNGALSHELVILPLAGDQRPGQRAVGPDGEVGEADMVGEASRTCGAGAGDEDTSSPGIAPGSSGWTTVNLPPGRYELICKLPGHYQTGMYAELDVSPIR